MGEKRRVRWGRLLVVVAIVAAVVFGLAIGFLALSNDSFPAQEKPFAQFVNESNVTATFNGTEIAYHIQWLNSSYVPLYAQLTSPATDAANTPVCGLAFSSVKAGQTIFMPFTISPESATLSNVDLSIAVRSLADGSDFTIVYNIQSVSATNIAITPSNVTCQQPQGAPP